MLNLTMTSFCCHEVIHSQHTKLCNIEEIVDRIEAMRKKGLEVYQCRDYLHEDKLISYNSNVTKAFEISGAIDENCREQICEWTYRVVDYFGINREIVFLSTSYLDRFLSNFFCDRRTFKLAATACLFLAVKVHEPRKLDLMGVLSDLSRGEFDMSDVIKMERNILEALVWKLNPPTPVCFVGHFLCLMPSTLSIDVAKSLSALSSFFTELSVFDYYFISQDPSTVAMASILNSMEVVSPNDLPRKIRNLFLRNIKQNISILPSSNTLREVRKRLWDAYERSEEYKVQNDIVHRQKHQFQEHYLSTSNCNEFNSPISVSGTVR